MNRFDAVPPVRPPIPNPRWRGDVINRTLGRAMTITAGAGALAAVVCTGFAIAAGWGGLWGWLVLYLAMALPCILLPFLIAGLIANWWSAKRYGRAAALASTDITMVLPGACSLAFGAVYALAAALGPGFGRVF